jgi:hypothetical protein
MHEGSDFRAGVKVGADRQPGELLTPLKAIRSHCMGCAGGSWREAALCSVTACPLWPYRFGRRTRAHRIVADERELAHVDGQHWAEKLDDYTSQRYYQTEQAGLAREKRLS